MVRFLGVLFILCGVAYSAQAQEISQFIDPEQRFPFLDFLILTTPPDDFYLGHRDGAQPNFIEEYIPKGETVENWTELLSVGTLGQMPPGVSFQKLSDDFHKLMVSQCSLFREYFRERGPVPLSYDLAYICMDQNKALLPHPEAAVIREVEISVTRYLNVNGILFHLQRGWHGSREEFENIKPNIEAKLQAWRNDLDRFSVCKLWEISKPCKGLDFEDKENTFNGQPLGVLHIPGKPDEKGKVNSFINPLQIDKDHLRKVISVLKMAENIWVAYTNNLEVTIFVTPDKGKEGSLLVDRKKAITFMTKLRETLIAGGIPAEEIFVGFYNFQ